ncbi:MAG: hypothetical protein Q7K98_06445 [Candidatus Omnitrophota bacterium]|nr:hypothetical protein [Candidatus Omnitrophota bacterium]
MPKKILVLLFCYFFSILGAALATPTTLIWTPSTDIQPYGRIHLNIDNYTPVKSRDHNDNQLYVQQVYGPTFSLLPDKPGGNGLASDSQSHKSLRVERMLEEGFEIIETPLPALLTVVKEINQPRIPSLKGMMRAKSAKIITWGQKDLDLDPQNIGLCGSPTQVVKIFTPPQRVGGQMLTGEAPEIAAQIVELLRNEIN